MESQLLSIPLICPTTSKVDTIGILRPLDHTRKKGEEVATATTMIKTNNQSQKNGKMEKPTKCDSKNIASIMSI